MHNKITIVDRLLRILCGKISFIYPILLKLLFEIVYIFKISPEFSYMGHTYSPNFLKMIISWLAFFLLYSFIYLLKEGFFKDVVKVFFLFSIITTLAIYWLKDADSTAFGLIMLYWFVYLSATYCFSRKSHEEKNQELVTCYFNENILLCVFAFVVISTVWFSARYGDFRLFVDFDDIDLYRHTVSMNRLSSYIFSWNSTVILPIILVIHIRQKKYIFALVDCVMFLLLYGVFANKSIFFTMIMAIAIGIVSQSDIRGSIDRLIGVFLILYQLICLIVPLNYTRVFAALDERIMAGPSEGHFYYFDFFRTGRKLYLSETSLGFFDSPYKEKTAILIGSSARYMSGLWNYFNNGLFSSAYANFGVFGIVFQPLLIVITYGIIMKCMKGVDISVKYIILMCSVLYLLSTTYTSWLVTGGVIPTLILVSVIRPRSSAGKY